ncbi:hypothetical protein [Streptomyces sp. RFCAC02]|uniref:hypothetical protein n=1 Tax=Streptomyces sp. RFCAC02 TaxID=2499143 RepID=UPI0010219811|nr:hypothetical protein [Streptomyces sp. RFCAC02]
MILELQRAANRRMRMTILVLAGLVVLLASGLLGALLFGGGSGEDGGSGAAPAASSSSAGPDGDDDDGSVETLPPSDGYTAPEQYVQLPVGSGETEGLPTGFPHTPEGAIAVLVSSSRYASSWDPEEIRRNIRVYATEDDKDELLALADQGAQVMRSHVGIPETGPIPPGATVNSWVIGVQWEELSADHVRVSTLVRLTYSAGEGEERHTELISATGDVVWEDGDWKNTPVSPEIASDAPEVGGDIGSQGFIDAGWIAIREGDRR